MPADLVTIRMRITGGKAAAAEAETAAAGMKAAETAAVGASKASGQAAAKQGQLLRKTQPILKSTGSTLSKYVTLPVLALAAYGIKTAATFQKSMAQVRVAGQIGGAGMKEMEHLALEMGAKTIFSANDSAEAMLNLIKAGVTPAEVKTGALAATMNLAATEGINLGKSGEIVAAAMNTFGLKASETGRISDALAGGANASSASVEGLAMSLSQGGQSAAMYGVSLNETVGTLAAFAQNGIQASDAGTSFKTFLMRLNPVTKKQRELMNELNLSFFDQQGKFVGLEKTATRLRKALGGMTQEQRGQALQTLFGSDAQRAANIVYKEGAQGLSHYITATKQRGAAEKMANAQMEGLPGAIERLKGSFETAALVIGQAMAPAIEAVAGLLEGLLNNFTELPDSMQTAIAVGMGVAALAGPMLLFASAIATAKLRMIELREAEAATGAGGLGSKLTKGRMAAGALGIGAMAGGAALGGTGGELLSNVGGGAAMGFAVGGPMGAAVGATAGAVMLAIPKVKELFGETKRLTLAQMQLKRDSAVIASGMKEQGAAAQSLAGATGHLRRATKAQHDAAQGVKRAENVLRQDRKAGAGNSQIIHDEMRLVQARRANIRAVHAKEMAERKHGVALQQYKQIARMNVLNERNEINVIGRKKAAIDREWVSAKRSGATSVKLNEIASRGVQVTSRYETAQRKLATTIGDAATKAGPKFASFLSNANRELLTAGSSMAALNQKAEQMIQLTERLSTLPAPGSNAGHGLHLPGNAAGTANWRGGLSVVGETGPELMNVPRGSEITPAQRTRELLSGSGDPARGSDRLRRYLEAGGRGGRKPDIRVPVYIGRQQVAEAVAEQTEDDEARM